MTTVAFVLTLLVGIILGFLTCFGCLWLFVNRQEKFREKHDRDYYEKKMNKHNNVINSYNFD